MVQHHKQSAFQKSTVSPLIMLYRDKMINIITAAKTTAIIILIGKSINRS